jgi:hypothetical protein
METRNASDFAPARSARRLVSIPNKFFHVSPHQPPPLIVFYYSTTQRVNGVVRARVAYFFVKQGRKWLDGSPTSAQLVSRRDSDWL